MLSSISSTLGRTAQNPIGTLQQIPGVPQDPLHPTTWLSNHNPSSSQHQQNPQQGPSGQIQPYQSQSQPQSQPYQQQQSYGYQSQVQPHQQQYSHQNSYPSYSYGGPQQNQVNPYQSQAQLQGSSSGSGYGTTSTYGAGSGFGLYRSPQTMSYSTVLSTSLRAQTLQEVKSDEDPTYGPLGRARMQIERNLVADQELSPDLWDLIAVEGHEPYSPFPSPSPAFRPFKLTSNIPLPDALMQELSYKDSTARTGLFEDIDRAWFTVDNKLFLWDYTDGREFSRYDEQSETITAVGLVKARNDIFVDDITYVLIICTATKVTLLGLSRPSIHEISLYATNLSTSLPVPMVQVLGTSAGRIFLRGENRELYELEYSSQAGWLFGSSSKVNVINRSSGVMARYTPSFLYGSGEEGVETFTIERATGRLFTLSSRGKIEYFDVSGNNFISKCSYSNLNADFARQAGLQGALKKQSDHNAPNRIVSISPIGIHESRRLILLAVSASGHRAYLSPDLRPYVIRKPHQHMTNTLLSNNTFTSFGTVIGVQNDTSQPTPASNLHIVTPNSGRLAAIKENIDNPAPNSGQLSEWYITDHIPSEIWAIAETTSGNPNYGPRSLERADGISLSPLARQMNSEARRFIILTSSGIVFALLPRPMDMLSDDIERERDNAVNVVRDHFGKTQTTAMGITIGSTSDLRNQDISSAVSSILYHAQAPFIKDDSTGRFIHYSPRHDGLALIITRLLRPIWETKVTRSVIQAPGMPPRQVLGIDTKSLLDVQGRLEQLRRYVEENPFPRMQAEGDTKIAWDQEYLSLNGLSVLLKQAIEAISFILFLNDYKISEVIARSDQSVQSTLSNLAWRDLITSVTGRDVAKKLVTSLIEQQIGQEIGIDTLSEVLQQRCGSFVQPGDVVLYKAEECMRRAEGSRDPSERSESLSEALSLFSRAASNIPDRLNDVSSRFRKLRYAAGAIELPLRTAAQVDPQDKALDFVNDGKDPNDPRKALCESRMACYSCVIECLEMYDGLLDDAVSSSIGVDAAAANRDEAYSLAIASDDELFHYYLYDWHVSRNLQEQLLQYDTPYIERYLQMTSENNTIEDRRDLLWKYYARREEYLLSARALHQLATREAAMNLNDRANYLAQAVMSARAAASVGAYDVDWTRSVEDQFDVAKVQQEVARAVEGHRDMSREEKQEYLDRLNADLFLLDDLYQNFARPLRLYEPILTILKTANTRIDDVCEVVWRSLLQESSGDDTNMSQAAVEEKVIDLCRRYRRSEAAPIDIVLPVVYTEAMSMSGTSEEGWATRALLKGGMSMQDCWEIVMELHDTAETDEEREYYAEEAGVLVENWVQDQESIPLAEVERFTSAFLLRSTSGEIGERKRRTRERMSKAKSAIEKGQRRW